MRPVPARLPTARRTTRFLLRARESRRPHRPRHVRPQLRLRHRPGREEAPQPFPARLARAELRHSGLQFGLPVLPELGHLARPRLGPRRRSGPARADCTGGGRLRRGVGGVHVQRPDCVRRVRDRHGRGLPGAGRPSDRGDGRVHVRRGPARLLRGDGRGEHRPEGVHGVILPVGDRHPPAGRAGHDRVCGGRDSGVGGTDDAADPRAQRRRCAVARRMCVDPRALRRGRAAALLRVPSGVPNDGRAGDAIGHVGAGAADRDGGRAAVRVHRQCAPS